MVLARVERHDVEIASIHSDIGDLRSDLKSGLERIGRSHTDANDKLMARLESMHHENSQRISGLETRQSTQGRFTLQGFVLFVAAACVPAGLLWGLAIGPTQGSVSDLKATAETTLKAQQEMLQGMVAVREKFAEVETQFYWQGDVDAGERADSARLMQLLWKRVYNEELPMKVPYQRGPQRHGNTFNPGWQP